MVIIEISLTETKLFLTIRGSTGPDSLWGMGDLNKNTIGRLVFYLIKKSINFGHRYFVGEGGV